MTMCCMDWDWWLRLPGMVRLCLLVGTLGGTGYVAWRFFVAPLRIPLNEDDMALAIERRHPDLGDRLISAVQFSRGEGRGGAISEEGLDIRPLGQGSFA